MPSRAGLVGCWAPAATGVARSARVPAKSARLSIIESPHPTAPPPRHARQPADDPWSGTVGSTHGRCSGYGAPGEDRYVVVSIFSRSSVIPTEAIFLLEAEKPQDRSVLREELP